MRPVDKSVAQKPTFTEYRDAAELLVNKLGAYCSYCERQIETHLAVEHIRPKSVDPTLETDWDNFLLSCVNCNSGKGDTPINVPDYIWPDSDNTLNAFVYNHGLVAVNSNLPSAIKQKAEALYLLVGLDKDNGNPDKERKPTKADRRWKFREDCWDLAQESYQDLLKDNSTPMRNQIVRTAISRGGFAIWFAVFSNDEDMRKRLIAAFSGTAHNCFDALGLPIARPGGVL